MQILMTRSELLYNATNAKKIDQRNAITPKKIIYVTQKQLIQRQLVNEYN